MTLVMLILSIFMLYISIVTVYHSMQCKIPVQAILTTYTEAVNSDGETRCYVEVMCTYNNTVFTKTLDFHPYRLYEMKVGEPCTVYIDASNTYVAGDLSRISGLVYILILFGIVGVTYKVIRL